MGRGECYAKAARLDAEIGYGAASLLLDSVRGLRAGDPAGAAGGTLTRGGAAGCARVLSAAVRGALRFGGETGAVGALRRADVSARARGGVSAGACWPGRVFAPCTLRAAGLLFVLFRGVLCRGARARRGEARALCLRRALRVYPTVYVFSRGVGDAHGLCPPARPEKAPRAAHRRGQDASRAVRAAARRRGIRGADRRAEAAAAGTRGHHIRGGVEGS